MSVPAASSTYSRLEPHLLLAKSARGAGAAQLVVSATSSPGCYVFAELLAADAIKNLADSEHAASYRLLELFAFGVLTDYRQAEASLPSLSPAQLLKLKQLTLITMASRARSLPYDELLVQLEMDADVRALEDLIIDAMYAGIIRGKLDQMRRRFEVEGCMGRDVRGEAEINDILLKLQEWHGAATNAYVQVTERIDAVQKASKAAAAARLQHEQKLARAFADLHNSNVNANNSGSNNAGNGINGGNNNGGNEANRPRYDRMGADREMDVVDGKDKAVKQASGSGSSRPKRSRP